MPKSGRGRSRKLAQGCYWRGNVIWYRQTVDGREHRESLRTDDADVARARAAIIRERLTSVAFGGAHRRTWQEAVVAWGEEIMGQVAPATAARYATSLEQIEPMLRDRTVEAITRATVEEIVAYRRRAGVTLATIRRDLSALSSVLAHAEAQGWREGNPARDRMGRLRERRDPIVLPSDADIARVIARAPGQFARLIEFARLTGMRQEEVASLEWRQVDGRKITIVGKGSKRRTIEISPAAGALLAALPRQLRGRAVFWHDDGQRYANVSARFAALTAGLAESAQRDGTAFRRFRFHDLRHRFAVDYLASGGSIYDLQRHLGHSSVKVTEIYLAHLTPDQERSARGGSTAAMG